MGRPEARRVERRALVAVRASLADIADQRGCHLQLHGGRDCPWILAAGTRIAERGVAAERWRFRSGRVQVSLDGGDDKHHSQTGIQNCIYHSTLHIHGIRQFSRGRCQ